MNNSQKGISEKLKITFLCFFILLFVVFFRVLHIQYIQGEKYRFISEKRTLRNDTIFPNRGNLLAAGGELLASSVTHYDIRMDLVTVSERLFTSQVENLALELSKLLGKSKNYWLHRLKQAREKKKTLSNDS